MEDSMNSYMDKQKPNPPDHVDKEQEEEEESGWTTYFQDFTNNNSFCTSSTSLISDAAFSGATSSHQNLPKKLNFKKTRTKQISLDDSLEDTASSPVNSPKLSDLEQIDDHHHHHMYSSLGKSKGGEAEKYYSKDQQRLSMDGININNDYIDLKRRGLCLVPVSMLVKYLP